MSCFLILLIIESKKMEMLSIPYIRFNKFDNEWFSKKLDLVSNVTMGQSPDSKNYTDNPNDYILVQGNADMQNGRVVPRVWTTQITKLAEKGDLILSVRAPVGDIGTTDYPVVLGRGVAAIRGNDFLFYLLSRMKQTNYWAKFSTGSTFESINSNDIKSAEICLPSQDEQSAIGSLFRTIDELLASYKDNLANYQSLKATMLSKMFPKAGQTVPEIRLDGFEGEWENIRLGDCAIIKGRLGWKSLKQEEYTEVGPSMIAGKHIKNGVIDWGEVDHIPQWRYDESPDIMLENGDIIFSKDGSLGNPALVSNLKGEATINSTMMLVRLDKKISSQFFYQVLTSSVFQKLIYLKVSGSSIPHLFQADMQDFKFYAPSIEEQQAIGSYFSNLDNLINSYQEKITQLETLKKKLLQDMFI